jgi:hypothetical protein
MDRRGGNSYPLTMPPEREGRGDVEGVGTLRREGYEREDNMRK